MIGIKIADGTYFPILEEGGSVKKKLVLTTVNDDQESVQIDLFKGDGRDMQDASYVGSLVIEDIMPMMKGEPEIELVIGIDSDGNLNAEAGEAASDERQSLSLSLTSLDGDDFAAPNFELDEDGFDDMPSLDEDFPSMEESSDEESFFNESNEEDESGVFDDLDGFDDMESGDDSMDVEDETFGDIGSFEEESFDEGGFEDSSFDDGGFDDGGFDEDTFDEEPSGVDDDYGEDSSGYPDEQPKKRNPLAVIVLVILIAAILGLGALLIIRGMNGDSVPPLEAENTPSVSEPEYAQPAEPEPEIVAEAEPEAPVQPEVKEKSEASAEAETVSTPAEEPAAVQKIAYDTVPPAGHGGGVWYRLKWGDTLWDLSNSFYRTPWLYGLIAVENEIKNPNIIYAGTDILIPEN